VALQVRDPLKKRTWWLCIKSPIPIAEMIGSTLASLTVYDVLDPRWGWSLTTHNNSRIVLEAQSIAITCIVRCMYPEEPQTGEKFLSLMCVIEILSQ